MKHLFNAIVLALIFQYTTQAQQWGNYTLYSTSNGTSTYLIDTNSPAITKKTWTHTTSTRTGYSSYLLPGGILLRTVSKSGNSFSGGPICGQVQKVDWNGNVIWDYVYSTTNYCTHHDICPMPNGNVLLIAYERKTAAQTNAAGCTQSIEMWPDKIVEVQPVGATGGNIVWEWHAWDHLVQNVNAAKANYQTSIVNHPELININYNTQKDWMHMNGVSYNPMLDQIAFSCHNLHEIYVIDHSTTTAEAATHSGGNSGKGGDILYRWGNPAAYGASGSQILNVTHDAHWNPENVPNPGFLCAYNNKGISSNASCGDQIDAPENGYNYTITPGSAFTPSSYTLRQASGGYNSNMGGFQVLPNGNILLTIATAGIIKEFGPSGNLLWSKTATGAVPKSFRYDSCYVFSPAPALPTVSLLNDTLHSSNAVTYQWYFNGYQIAGATNSYYVPTTNGNYKVRTTDVNGCMFTYSTDYKFSTVTAIAANSSNVDVTIYPNPSNGLFNIRMPNLADFTVTVNSMLGSEILKQKNTYTIDLSMQPAGIYYVRITNALNQVSTQRITIQK
ncbi:MAG: aryl-sulfate sulfotransferase [Bacteroidia bacterium]|nr:aryl-sulfate sulfotransferase [Bacteroidia bacterium]